MSPFDPHPTRHLAELNGKTAIVTGGARGIGAATAKVFNLHGTNVVIADVPSSNEVAQKLIASLPYPEKALFYPVNILNWEQMLGLFRETIRRFGSIDTVVANAGIMEKTDTLDIESTDENGNLLESTGAFNVIDVNIKGTLNSKHFQRPVTVYLRHHSATSSNPLYERLPRQAGRTQVDCPGRLYIWLFWRDRRISIRLFETCNHRTATKLARRSKPERCYRHCCCTLLYVHQYHSQGRGAMAGGWAEAEHYGGRGDGDCIELGGGGEREFYFGMLGLYPTFSILLRLW
jgi:hypothetical protein